MMQRKNKNNLAVWVTLWKKIMWLGYATELKKKKKKKKKKRKANKTC